MDLQPNKQDAIVLPITNTRISASEWNQLVGSCMAFITAAGLTPDAADMDQFLNAFKAIAADLELVGANTNLSNLTATGEAKFNGKVDLDAANLSDTGKSLIAGLGMPSSVYDDLTLGASGSTYMAPANGWLVLKKLTNGGNQEIRLTNESNGLVGYAYANNSGFSIGASIICKAGDEITVYYSAGGATQSYRFIYAEGSKQEAN